MKTTCELEMPFGLIEVKVDFDITNSGIGHYEFHGQRCFDRGEWGCVINETEFDKTGFSEEQVEAIEEEIEKKTKDWEYSILEEAGTRND
jgi:hypothetical protein